jgi:hypothetical protein
VFENNPNAAKNSNNKKLKIMKKNLFFFAMLISVAASAQTGITITPVSATYTGTPTIQFSISWLNSSRTGTHNSKVWVFIDYRTITDNAPSGAWIRALISGTPTVTIGTPSRETGNDKGFWLQGTSGSSGTYNTTVTVKLRDVPAKFNWCAYATDYPPNATVKAEGGYDLKGTPPFTITYDNGSSTTTDKCTFDLGCITAITDATDNPTGIVPGLPAVDASAASTACIGAAVIFTATASGGTTTAMTYTWNIAGALSSTTAPTYSKAFSTIGSNTYSVSAKNSNGCVSATSPVKTITISVGATRDQAVGPCSCVSGLIACNGYCRDLVADDARCIINLEVKNDWPVVWQGAVYCPTGWSVLSENELIDVIAALGATCSGRQIWTAGCASCPTCRIFLQQCGWRCLAGDIYAEIPCRR